MIELTRRQVLEGSYKYPTELVKLIPTKHVIDRLGERGLGLDCIPTMVRVTKENIHSAKTMDGIHLTSVVVRLKYNDEKYLFLCLNPYDGGTKTMWFRNKRRVEYGNRIYGQRPDIPSNQQTV
jgi:hypothetical protein